MKKFLSLLLALCLLLTAAPMAASANEIYLGGTNLTNGARSRASSSFIHNGFYYSSFSQAISSAQGGDKTVYLASGASYTMAVGEVIPAGITLVVQEGASLSFGGEQSFFASKGSLQIDAGGVVSYPNCNAERKWVGNNSSTSDIVLSKGRIRYDFSEKLLLIDARSQAQVPSEGILALSFTRESNVETAYNLNVGLGSMLAVYGTLDVSAGKSSSFSPRVNVYGTLNIFEGVLKLAKDSEIEVGEDGTLHLPYMTTRESDDIQPVEWVKGRFVFNYGSTSWHGSPNGNPTVGFTILPQRDGKVVLDYSNVITPQGIGFLEMVYSGEVTEIPNGTAYNSWGMGDEVPIVLRVESGGDFSLLGKLVTPDKSQIIVEHGGTFNVKSSGALQIEKGSSINGEITLSEGAVVVRDPSAISGATIKLNGQNTTVLADTDISSKIKGKYRPIEDKEKLSFNCAIAGLVDMVPFKMGWEYGEPVVPEEPTLYKNTTNSPSNGLVRISPTEAKEGDTVTITVTPNDGYEIGTVSATRKDGTAVTLTSAGTGRYTYVQPASDVSVSVSFEKVTPPIELQTTTVVLPIGYTSTKTVAPQGDVLLVITNSAGDTLANIYIPSVLGDAKNFVDNRSGWYKEAVDKASALKLFNGVSETEFAPNSPMTRAMWVTVLHNLSSHPSYGYGFRFTDVSSGSWYDMPVQWAYSLGITSGTSATTFSPLQNITREQMVTMLYRYAKLIGVDSDNRASLSGFTDSDEISSYAYDAMRWAVAEGFITGMGDGTVDPKGNSTRAQVATVLTKFVEYIAGRDVTDPPAVPLSTQNGYYICPICKYVNEVGTPCIACSTINQAKPEAYCPTCGGAREVGGAVAWTYCNYCQEYFVSADIPSFTCWKCGKDELSPSDLAPYWLEICKNCYDSNPKACPECGLTSNDVGITKYGICTTCCETNHKGEYSFGYCDKCGASLSAYDSVILDGRYCYNCRKCKYCHQPISVAEYREYGEFICEDCSKLPKVYCKECGADITGDQTVNGLCFECFSSHPNVYCPNCGYGFFTTGVGTDGFFCPECGHNWLP